MPPRRRVGDRHAASWNLFLKDQPENFNLLDDLALTNMGLGDKAAALALAERAIAANPIEKDAISGPSGIETLARVAAQLGEPDRAIAALRKLLSIPAVTDTAAPFTAALLRLDPMFDPLRNDPRFQELVAPAGIKDLSAPAQIPEKSIAVLPFENRSSDPENAFFTDGVQDEILTDLARIADLKVISRTSVMQYKTGAKRNLRQIGNELGVAHVCGRKCSACWQSRASKRAVDRCAHRCASLGADLRSRSGRRFRYSKRDRKNHRRSAPGEAFAKREECH